MAPEFREPLAFVVDVVVDLLVRLGGLEGEMERRKIVVVPGRAQRGVGVAETTELGRLNREALLREGLGQRGGELAAAPPSLNEVCDFINERLEEIDVGRAIGHICDGPGREAGAANRGGVGVLVVVDQRINPVFLPGGVDGRIAESGLSWQRGVP